VVTEATALNCISRTASSIVQKSKNTQQQKQKQKQKHQRFFFPRTDRQVQYANLLGSPIASESSPDIIVAVGPAGTSKTLGAVLIGLEKLVNGEVDRLVLTRPAVSADEELGFLPGTLDDKMSVWLLPVVDSLRVCLQEDEVERLMKSRAVEIGSLSHMRGRTFRNSFVIVDECQNTTPAQMLMLLTRIGDGSRFVFTGDPQQHDRGAEVSGVEDFVRRYYNCGEEKSSRAVQLFEFDRTDVQRHPTISTVLSMYDH